MRFTETIVRGAYVIDIERAVDERGFFARTFDPVEFASLGLEADVAQCSLSWNGQAGTIRGLHFQAAPHEEVKIVRCTLGAVWDVMVDLRASSPTFLQWVAVELNQENRRMVYVPKGVAHGYQTLADGSELCYQVSATEAKASARGVRWDDPVLAIAWPRDVTIISARDRAWPDIST